jgi:hypothetical protein
MTAPRGAADARLWADTGFRPSRHGFLFANRWPAIPAIQVELGGMVSLGLGRAADGLCGGMVWTARDLWEAGLAPPPDLVSPPSAPDPRFGAIVARQLDSLVWGIVPLAFWRSQLAARLWGAGALRHSLRHHWPAIRTDLRRGRPAVVGLIRQAAWSPMVLRHQHQVLAWAYRTEPTTEGGRRLVLSLYDPNHPGRDDVELIAELGPDGRSLRVSQSTAEPVLGFFRLPYRFRDPAAWR